MNYTKGEWKAYIEHDNWHIEADQGGYCYTIATLDSRIQANANAHLIAAAPEMYEALKGLLEGLDNPMRTPAFELVDKASLALAKANLGKEEK